jgi:RNA polymerase sigma factor (sigma-70 family)
MSSNGSVTCWISALKGGDPLAAQKLWERYFSRLVGLARKKVSTARRREADEEDVALSAFASLCQGIMEGRFPRLEKRDDLWPLLVVITGRKALDLLAHQGRRKRGGGKVRGDSALLDLADSAGAGLDTIVGNEPTPEILTIMAEEYQRLLDLLDDDELRSIAVWKMERHTNQEIAERLDCSLAKVERRLGVIRKRWESKSTS